MSVPAVLMIVECALELGLRFAALCKPMYLRLMKSWWQTATWYNTMRKTQFHF